MERGQRERTRVTRAKGIYKVAWSLQPPGRPDRLTFIVPHVTAMWFMVVWFATRFSPGHSPVACCLSFQLSMRVYYATQARSILRFPMLNIRKSNYFRHLPWFFNRGSRFHANVMFRTYKYVQVQV